MNAVARTFSTEGDYKVADISLADWGRKEIDIAEHEMPGLMSIRQKYAADQAAQGRARDRLAAHDHPDRGADRDAEGPRRRRALGVAATSSRTQDHAAAAIAATGTPVFAWKGETLEEYWDCTLDALTFTLRDGKGPQLVVDDGGDVTLLIHKGYELENGDATGSTRASGSHEEQVIKNLLKRVAQRAPGLLDHAWSRTGRASPRRPPPACTASTRWSRRASCWCRRSTSTTRSPSRSSTTSTAAASRWPTASSARLDVMLAGKVAVVCGYGDVGKGSAHSLRGLRRARHRHRDRPDQRAAGGDGRLRGHHRRGHPRPRRHLRHHHRQLDIITLEHMQADEGPGHRLQHRPLRQRDPGRRAERQPARRRPTSSRRWTSTPSPTATASSCWPKAAW